MRQAKRREPAKEGANALRPRKVPPELPSLQEGRRLFLESRRYHAAGSREDLNFHFTSLVTQFARRWRTRLNEHLVAIGQTQARWESLFWIEIAAGQVTQKELARRVGIEGPTFARMLDRLEKEGLVERRASPWDRRTKTIALKKGAAPRLKELNDVIDKVRAQMLQDIDAADLVTCISILQRIVPKLERP
jgi:MarR family transcriptional regulator, transcriptional regulator for hemolysin